MLNRIIYNRELHKDEVLKMIQLTVGEDSFVKVESLLEECKMNYWQGDEKDGRFHCLTYLINDEVEGQLVLLIYAIHVTGKGFSKEGWKECYKDLQSYGKKLGCSCLVAYTENPRVIRIGRMLGGKAKVFMQFPIEGGDNGRLLE